MNYAIIDKTKGTIAARVESKGARIGDRLLVSPTVAGWENDEYRILPVEEVDPAFDAATQLRSEWNETVLADKVVRERTVTDKSAEQLAAEAERRKDTIVDRMDPLLADLAFAHENRIRALEGLASLTDAEFKASLKALL